MLVYLMLQQRCNTCCNSAATNAATAATDATHAATAATHAQQMLQQLQQLLQMLQQRCNIAVPEFCMPNCTDVISSP